MTDPPAPARGALLSESALANIRRWSALSQASGLPGGDMAALLAHIDAQAAQLAAMTAFLRAVQQHGWDAACEVLGDPLSEGAAAGAAGEGAQ